MRLSLRGILRKFRQEEKPVTPPLGLEPLHPENGKKGHDIYVRELNDAISKDSIRNIALTGSYGSGKSSILSDFVKEQGEKNKKTRKKERIILISLATLGNDSKNTAPKAKSEDDKENSTEAHVHEKDQSNSIQKEIVKQLLFREAPHKVPNSKFKRVTAPYTPHIAFVTFILSVIATTILYYRLEPALIQRPDNFNTAQLLGLLALLFIVVFSLTFLLLLWLNGKFTISRLSGGPIVPISIAKSKDNNYFDQYLDELIYFFQVTDYDVVIFEDIERFDNTYIFVALKQLNNLLNDAGQIRATKKRIRFIYAIRDSLFCEGNFTAFEESTNRAKFFDLIISVVPLVTHLSSSDVMMDLFITKGKLKISKEVITTVAKHVVDMRLIKNIYNEYRIFEKQLLGKDKLEGLTPDKLFAMIAYKNTNLKDFESIKLGTSKLDKIYSAFRKNVNDNINQLQEDLWATTTQLEEPQSIATRSEIYGERLISFLRMITSANSFSNVTYSLAGKAYTEEQLKSSAFWISASSLSSDGYFGLKHYLSGWREMRITRTMLEEVIRDSLDTKTLEEEDKKKLRQERAQLQKELAETSYQTLQELLDSESSVLFRSKVQQIIGKVGDRGSLLYGLLKAGYIDTNFTLYTSIFHGTNPKAANFVIHHLQANKADFHYKFKSEGSAKDDTDENIKALLDGAGGGYLKNKCIYNIDIVDYLLRNAKRKLAPNNEYDALDDITDNLIQEDSRDTNFLNEYMRSGAYPEKLIKLLSAKWASVFNYLVPNQDILASDKIKLFDAALSGVSGDIQYQIEEDVVDYIADNAQNLDALTKPLPVSTASNLAKVLPQFGMKLASLSRLSDPMKEIVVKNDLYTITQKNIEEASGAKNLSLDSILAANENVFMYLADHLQEYLSAIADSKRTKHTIDDRESFIFIIEHLVQSDPENITPIIQKASRDCVVNDLSEIPPGVWSILLDDKRTTASLNNVMAYYRQQNATIDEHLVQYLNSEKQIDKGSSPTEEEELLDLTLAVLKCQQIDPATRSDLADNIGHANYVAPDELPLENGELYGRLLEDGIIDDKAEAYNYIKGLSIETRMHYIAHSSKFSEYIDKISLDSEEIEAIAGAENISPEIKKYLVAHLAELDPKPSVSVLQNLAKFALANNLTLSVDSLRMVAGSVDTLVAVQLINLSTEAQTIQSITELLVAISAGYEKLTQRGQHPSLEDNPYNAQLIENLKHLGMVGASVIKQTKKGPKLQAHMKRGW